MKQSHSTKERHETKPLKRKVLVHHRQLAVDVKRPERPYKLEGTQIRLWLTEEQAKDRNAVLNDKTGKWRPDPAAFADQVKENPNSKFSWAEWRRRLSDGIRKDNEWYAAIKSKQESEIQMSKDAKKAKKVEKKTTSDSNGSNRQKHLDLGMCAWIRLCGKKGFGPEKTKKILKSMKLDANPATISIQLRKGRKDEDVPNLTKEQKEEFAAISGDIPNDEVKKSKKSDGGKKKMVKKHKKAKEPEEEAAEADSADDEDLADEEEVEVDEEESEEEAEV